MMPIIHILTTGMLCLGFVLGYFLKIQKVWIILLILGFTAGMSIHMWLDGIDYSKESFKKYCVDLEPHPQTPFYDALCMISGPVMSVTNSTVWCNSGG